MASAELKMVLDMLRNQPIADDVLDVSKMREGMEVLRGLLPVAEARRAAF